MRNRSFLVLVALWAVGCGLEPAAHPAPVGTVAPHRCPARTPPDARCAHLSVYENRSARSGRVIPLRIVVLPAHDARAAGGPVFFLAGGPGQAATELMRYRGIVNPHLRDRHDLVFLDQRGTGGSNALTCRFYGPPMDVQSYFAPFMPIEKVRACRDELSARADLTQYTTAHAVEDLEDVREAFDYERINLVGGSYGTRLAMEYVRRYEHNVRTVVLEGVAAPSMQMPEGFGVVAQQALDALLDECAATPGCAAAYPSIWDQAREVFVRLNTGPVKTTVPHPGSGQPVDVLLTKEHVAETIRYMTYSSHEAGQVPLALAAAHRGDFSAIARSLLRRRGDGTFDGLYLSITCTEDVPFVADDAEAREASTYLSGYRVREQKAACAEWPRGPAPEWIGRPVVADVPALLLSGALDPATSPASGHAVAQTLPNSLHVTIPYGGHSPAGLTGLECLDALKLTFLERGSVEGLDASCVAHIRRHPFATAGS